MPKYLKLFNKHSEYETYSAGKMILPNVSYCIDVNDVHYNPIGLKVSGKFTVPSRLFEMKESSVEPEHGPIRASINTRLKTLNSYKSCYGLADGIKKKEKIIITYNNEEKTPLFISDYNVIQENIIDSQDDKTYQYISLKIPTVPVDKDGNLFEDQTIIENNEKFYKGMISPLTGRIDKDGKLEFGRYEETEDSQTFVSIKRFPLFGVKENLKVYLYDNITNKHIFTLKEAINTGYYEYVDDTIKPIEDEEYIYNGDFNFVEECSYYNLIVPNNNFITSKEELKKIFNIIEIDGEEINLDELYDNNGWYKMEEGEHTIIYRINKCATPNGYLAPGIFNCVPIEELQLDRKIKGCGHFLFDVHEKTSYSTFDGCALLGTDEETINKVCKERLMSVDENGFRVIDNKEYEPIVLECEFADNDDIIYDGYSNLSNGNYFTIHNGIVGMHICNGSSGSGEIAQ